MRNNTAYREKRKRGGTSINTGLYSTKEANKVVLPVLVQRVDKGGASQSLQAALPALTGLDGNVIQPSGSQQAQPRYNTRSQNQTQQAKTVDLQEEVEEEDDEEMEKKEFDQGDKVKKQKKMQRKLIRPGDWQKLALKLLNELIQVEDEENQEIHNDILQRMLKVGAYPIVSFINFTLLIPNNCDFICMSYMKGAKGEVYQRLDGLHQCFIRSQWSGRGKHAPL